MQSLTWSRGNGEHGVESTGIIGPVANVWYQALSSEEGTMCRGFKIFTQSQGQNLALTFLDVPSSLHSGGGCGEGGIKVLAAGMRATLMSGREPARPSAFDNGTPKAFGHQY